jgi:hypothetical protein
MYEEQFGNEFWAEPIAPLSSDPMYLLMAEEEGELDESDPEDITLRSQYRGRASRDRVGPEFLLMEQSMKSVDSAVRKAVVILKRDMTKNFESKLEILIAMGVDMDDAIDMLL